VTAPTPVTAPLPSTSEGRRKLLTRKRIAGALAATATIIGVLSSSTSLFDWLEATVSPSTPLPAKIDASVAPPALIDANQPLGTYLSDTHQSTAGLDAYQLAEHGYEFLVDIHLQGDRGQHIVLRWSIVDEATGNPLPGPTYNQDAAALVAEVQDQERQWPIWVPSPPRRGRFALRIILLDPKRLPLAEADSKPFTLTRAPRD
jgi:hypothetical protein